MSWWQEYSERMAIERERKTADQDLRDEKDRHAITQQALAKARHDRDEAQMEYADALRDRAQARAEIALWRTAYANAFDAWTALKQEVQQAVDAKQAKLPPGND